MPGNVGLLIPTAAPLTCGPLCEDHPVGLLLAERASPSRTATRIPLPVPSRPPGCRNEAAWRASQPAECWQRVVSPEEGQLPPE